MKTSSRFHRVVTFAFAAVFAAAASADESANTWQANASGEWSGSWTDVDHWSKGAEPTSSDDVVLPVPAGATANYTVTANAAIEVRSLTVGSGSAGGALAIFESHTASMHQIGGDLLVRGNGKMMHSANTTRKNPPLNESEYFGLRLAVGGNATLEEGAVLDATEMGYPAEYAGPGKGANSSHSPSHGGRGARFWNDAYESYGSIEHPETMGSSGLGSGGGVIRLDVTGDLSLDGRISANGGEGISQRFYSGAGGSIWISAARMTGSGLVEANGAEAPAIAYLGGGGGRVAMTVGEGGFADWRGHAHAYGGGKATASNPSGAAGTVYLKDGNSQGIVLIDNNGENAGEFGVDWPLESYDTVEFLQSVKLVVTNGGCVRIGANATVSDVCIEQGGVLTVPDGLTLGVSGFFRSMGTIAQSGAVELIGPAETTVSGRPVFTNFKCTEPGKTIRFATGGDDFFGIAEFGSITLAGTADDMIKLYPENPNGIWNIKVPKTATVNLTCLAVSNSNATVGDTIVVQKAETKDCGGNEGWLFLTPTEPGEQIVWRTDAKDDNWFNAANWRDKYGQPRLVVATDFVTIPSGCDHYPRASEMTIDVWSLTVDAGASLALTDVRLVTTNLLSVSGSLTMAGDSHVDCYGDVVLSGTYAANGSIFSLLGDGDQNAALGGNSFREFFVKKNGGAVRFANGFSAKFFRMDVSAATAFEFLSGANFAFGTFVVIGGRDGDRRTELKSSVERSAWNLAVSGSAYCAAVSVSDSNASGGEPIVADADSVGADARNANWQFGGSRSLWVGASGADFCVAANWVPARIPGASDDVFLLPPLDDHDYTVTASQPICVKSLTIGSGKSGVPTVTFESWTAAQHRIDGDLTVHGDGRMTHAANTTTKDNPPEAEVYKLKLSVGGRATIDAGAVLDVSGKGYPPMNRGPGKGAGSYYSPTHGGRGRKYAAQAVPKPCYGSIEHPETMGSSGLSAGGGVVCLAVAGALSLNGPILANGLICSGGQGYYTGAGGSVSISAESISGSGDIEAKGGEPDPSILSLAYLAGGGGRIALTTVAADGLAQWRGHAYAYGGAHAGDAPGGNAGTVYRREGNQTGVVIVDNNDGFSAEYGADLPVSDTAEFFASANLVVTKGGALYLTGDVTVNDIDLQTANAALRLNEYTLTVLSTAHRNHRHWAKGAVVTCTTNATTGAYGKIVWKKSGFMLIIK